MVVNYGGDEVSAIVLDIGTSSVRAGYAGDDVPKAIIPSSYGYISAPQQDADISMDTGHPSKNTKLYIGQHGPSMFRPGMEVDNPLRAGLIENFDPIPDLISHALRDVMHITPSEHPVLVTEPPYNTAASRERMAEIMFEEFDVPAFYIANTGVLNAFAAGKGSALVVDVGLAMASVTPVVDGFVLRKGLVYSALPKLVHGHARHLLTGPTHHRPGIELWPHQVIAHKMPVDAGAPTQCALRQDRIAGITENWRMWAENHEVDEWIQSAAGVLEQGWNDVQAQNRPPVYYEFPTGYNYPFGGERFQVGEQYFSHSPQLQASNPNLPKAIPALIVESLRHIDPDLRQILSSNIVVTGGGTMLTGFAQRLHAEVMRHFAHAKIAAPGNTVERRYGAWLGGSILASLGTFHQLWISKEEWQEHGKLIVSQRCK